MALGIPITADEHKQIVQLRATGLSLRKIGEKLNRDRKTIGRVLSNPTKYKKGELDTKSNDSASVKSSVSKTSSSKNSSKASSVKSKKPQTNGKAKYSKSKIISTASKQITSRQLAEYNTAVNLEHRSVIKFLTKLGENPSNIYSQLRKVYKPFVPDLAAVQYWVKQFKHGRRTILNDPKTVQKISQAKLGKKKSVVKKVVKKKPASKSPTKKKKPIVKEKSNPIQRTEAENDEGEKSCMAVRKDEKSGNVAKKRPSEISMGLFTIKLPGMDRLNKAIH